MTEAASLPRKTRRFSAGVMSLLLWRPHRKLTLPSTLHRILLVRVDNRVGEALLMTPLISTLKADARSFDVSVLTHQNTARVLEDLRGIDHLYTINPRTAWWMPWNGSIKRLRREKFDLVIDCTNWEVPSVRAAILSRAIASHCPVAGPSARPCARLRDIVVAPLASTRSEVEQRLHLLSPIPGLRSVRQLSFRKPRIGSFEGYLSLSKSKPFAVVNPGGRLFDRRAPIGAFTAAALEVQSLGLQPIVTWGPGERDTAEEIVATVPGSELAPPTNLDELAALMESAQMTICNNTGPMHLAVAVGCPTLALFFGMDAERWGYSHPPHRVLDLTGVTGEPEIRAAVCSNVRAFSSSLTKLPEIRSRV